MNIFDVIVILILMISAIVGFKRGFIKQFIFLVGTILIFIIAFNLKENVGNFLCKYLPFFSFKGNLNGVVTLNILIYQSIAFVLVASILYTIFGIVMSVTKVMQKIVNMTIILAIPSKILGLIVGLIEGYIILFAISIVTFIPLNQVPEYQDSLLVNKIKYESPFLTESVGDITSAISDIYLLINSINNKSITTNEINLKSLDIMLKYKIVSVKTVRQLEALDKLKGISNVEKVIDKYR